MKNSTPPCTPSGQGWGGAHPPVNPSLAKTICEVSNIDDELEHLRNVLKMNGYPRHFIDNAMKTPQSIQQKIEY